MSASAQNPLLSPPFYVVPGIDPSAPVSAQIEQIDQLNTLLLQEIDANFAKFHQIITTRILPEIKRFAITGEPTREASLFWKSFFEAAAAVRVPVPGESSLLNAQSAGEEYHDRTLTLDQDASFFDAGHGAVHSTPLPGREKSGGGAAGAKVFDESWEESMESPFDRVERKLADIGGGYASSDAPTPSLPSGYSLPKLDEPSYGGDASTGAIDTLNVPKQGDTPKAARKPFAQNPAGGNQTAGGNKWNGIADLRSTPLNAKFGVKGKGKPKPSLAQTIADLTMEDDEEVLPQGMSPPVTMTFNLPPRASAIMAVGRTPTRPSTGKGVGVAGKAAAPAEIKGKDKEARLILDDLMEEMEMGYEPSPRMPTPEGLGRYSMMPGDLDGARRDLFGAAPVAASGPTRRSMANTSYGSDIVRHPGSSLSVAEAEGDASFDDSFDSAGSPTTHHVSGAPVSIASQHGTLRQGPGQAGQVPISGSMHSYDEQHEIIGDESYISDVGAGGLPPGAGAGRAGHGEQQTDFFGKGTGAGGAHGRFSLMKQDEMHTFHGGRLEDAAGREVADSPTNAVRR